MKADRRFRCHRPEEAAELAQAVAAAAAPAKGAENRAETLMSITRPYGAQGLLVDVAPLRESGRELDFALEGAVITLIDPTHSRPLRIDNFIKLYALTPTEAAVCELMMQGCGLEEIAERRGRSPVTVKNQVAAILAKCGVRSRSEMLRLAVRILPPLQ
jgi:DNA-binding NarL/FixJ family response regulator